MTGRIFLYVLVFLTFTISPNLLYVLGVNYNSETGSPVARIHIATILAIAVAVLLILSQAHRSPTPSANVNSTLPIRPPSHYLPVAIVIVAGVSIWTLVIGNPLSTILVTYLTPVLFVYVLRVQSTATRAMIGRLVLFILFTNSLWGIAEQLLAFRPLPRLAGTTVYTGDMRSFGFIGHPLTSSVVTGLAIIYYVSQGLSHAFRSRIICIIATHGAALFFFGGRLAIAAAVGILISYALFHGSVSRASGRKLSAGRRLAFVAGVGLALTFVVASGSADIVISRILDDEGSAVTRSESVELMRFISASQWLTGLTSAEQFRIAQSAGIRAQIEVTWIALVLNYGLVFGGSLIALIFLTIKEASSCSDAPYVRYMNALFLICITGFLGLGTKSLLLAWYVCIVMALPYVSQEAARDATARSTDVEPRSI